MRGILPTSPPLMLPVSSPPLSRCGHEACCGQTALSGGANTGTHIWGFPKPTLSATPGALTRGYGARPQEKGKGAKTEQEVVNDHSIHEGQSRSLCTELTLSPNPNRHRGMAGDLHAANEHAESPSACCLLVLNTKLRREPTPFNQPLPPTPPPLPLPIHRRKLQRAKNF